jgi:hypothetical protein
MPIEGSAGIVAPLAAFAAIALLGLALRLLVGRGRSPGRAGTGARNRSAAEDFGLLRVAALAEDVAGAHVVCGLLARAGIRATVAPAVGDRVRVLVFAADLERARAVVSGPPAALD